MTTLATYPFTDLASGREVTLGIDDDRAAGVDHPGCGQRADVSPDLDAFYCQRLGQTG